MVLLVEKYGYNVSIFFSLFELRKLIDECLYFDNGCYFGCRDWLFFDRFIVLWWFSKERIDKEVGWGIYLVILGVDNGLLLLRERRLWAWLEI